MATFEEAKQIACDMLYAKLKGFNRARWQLNEAIAFMATGRPITSTYAFGPNAR